MANIKYITAGIYLAGIAALLFLAYYFLFKNYKNWIMITFVAVCIVLILYDMWVMMNRPIETEEKEIERRDWVEGNSKSFLGISVAVILLVKFLFDPSDNSDFKKSQRIFVNVVLTAGLLVGTTLIILYAPVDKPEYVRHITNFRGIIFTDGMIMFALALMYYIGNIVQYL